MALSHEAQALIRKLEVVHTRATNGDQEAMHFVKSLKTRALSGEEVARRIYNTIAAIHWKKRKGGDYDRAEAYYLRLRAREPSAMQKLQVLLGRVRSHDPEAKTLFSVLKSIHHKHKSSAFSEGPGSPKIGGYPLPEHDRAGIVFGADVSASPYTCTTCARHGGGNPMSQLPSSLHSRPPIGTFVPGARRAPASVGAAFPGRRPPIGTLPLSAARPFSVGATSLTQDALMGLMALMSRVRQMTFENDLVLSSRPSPSGFSTVPAPSGMNTAEPAICSAARTAVARNSPAAPGLVASCRQLGIVIPFDEARWRASQPTSITPTARVEPGVTYIRPTARIGPSLSEAQLNVIRADQQAMCANAAKALAMGNIAGPGLAATCLKLRQSNIMAGIYLPDGMTPNDPAYRVLLTDAGNAVLARNPPAAQFAASIASPARRRGFTMAMGVRAGNMDPGFPAFVRPGLAGDPELLAGFEQGMTMA